MKQTLHERLTDLAAAAEGGVVVIASEDLMWMVKQFPAPEITTEWGLHTRWGFDPSRDRDTAENVIKNMRRAGHEASLAWRGKTKWQVHDGDD